MKKLEYFFVVCGFLSAILAVFVGLKTDTSFGWALITILWTLVVFMKMRTIDKLEGIIKNMRDENDNNR